jgi:hypothetical protein
MGLPSLEIWGDSVDTVEMEVVRVIWDNEMELVTLKYVAFLGVYMLPPCITAGVLRIRDKGLQTLLRTWFTASRTTKSPAQTPHQSLLSFKRFP